MPTITILGAGPGTGLGIARSYGQQGYDIALVARRADALNELVATLRAEGHTASAYPADVTDFTSITDVAAQITADLGHIDAMVYSPAPDINFTAAKDLTPDGIQLYLDLYLYGLIAGVQAVLPGMIERGRGSIVFVNGATALGAPPTMSGPAPALAAARNYLQTLRGEVAPSGVVVVAVLIAAVINGSATDQKMSAIDPTRSFPTIDPSAIADTVRELVSGKDFERILPQGALDR